ncbi:MAG: hypothetical protein ACRDHX_00140 [Chloroflexota bacterium]
MILKLRHIRLDPLLLRVLCPLLPRWSLVWLLSLLWHARSTPGLGAFAALRRRHTARPSH